MGMKTVPFEPQMKIRGAVTSSRKTTNSGIKGAVTMPKDETEKPVKGSVERKQFGTPATRK